jgi:hypothetical protein
MRTTLMKLTVGAATAVAAIGLAAAPANAAGPVDVPFRITYGASVSAGTVHFTVGSSASVTGTVHATSTEKQVCAEGFNGTIETGLLCSNYASPGGSNVGFTFPFTISARGGVNSIAILMFDADVNVTGSVVCDRSGCQPV